ncbi:hypothetical protein [Helicobacter sp. T3_23-1059]
MDFWRWFYFPLPCGGGLRGWVSLEVSKSPAFLKSQNLQKQEKADSSKADIANAKSNNANFASAKSTHPQTPSAMGGGKRINPPRAKGGGFKKHCHSFKGGAYFGFPRIRICVKSIF